MGNKKAHNQVLLPAITYPAPCLSLTEHECYKIQKKSLPVYISSQGFSISTNRTIIHASERFGVLSVTYLHINYTYQKTKQLLYHLRKQDTTGKLAAITIQNHQLEMGTLTPILESDWNKTSILITKTWFSHLWKSLSDLKVKLIIPNILITKETTIMDKLIGKVPKKDIIKFNEIRKFLKYFHLEEISSPEERKNIITDITYKSTWEWPESPMTPRWKLIWTRLIKNTYTF